MTTPLQAIWVSQPFLMLPNEMFDVCPALTTDVRPHRLVPSVLGNFFLVQTLCVSLDNQPLTKGLSSMTFVQPAAATVLRLMTTGSSCCMESVR